MYALQLKLFIYFCSVLLIANFLLVTDALSNSHSRRRPALSSAKQVEEDVTEKSEIVADQLALASSSSNEYRRGGTTYPNDGISDYAYGNLEMNLIRPENEPIHTQITTKYTSSISTNPSQRDPTSVLDDTETAEEYVAKAMQMYGARLREPIRIPSESENSELLQTNNAGNTNYEYFELANKAQFEQQQQPQQQKQHMTIQQQQQQEQHQPQQPQQQQDQQQTHQELDDSDSKLVEAEMQAQLQAHLHSDKFVPISNDREHDINVLSHQQPAPVYEKDPVTRSYEVYDENTGYDAAGQQVERHYHTKYIYQQPTYHDASREQDAERVSASTEIPKAEIMKQIEKSVMKYMKALEAEGKIMGASQEQKTHHKAINVPTEENRVSSTTIKPKFATSTYHGNYNREDSVASSPSRNTQQSSVHANAVRHHMPKHSPKSHQIQYQPEAPYQATTFEHQPDQQHQDISEVLAPNVEFVYKIKTRAPLQTATVKTVSKPYTLPLKMNYDQFDHSAALKNLEEFDLSHVVTTQEPDERPSSMVSVASSKPSKLYFNSEIYHDINSLPYKPEKSRPVAAEYRKVKATDFNTDYKGYSGYFAEPATATDADKESTGSSSSVSDDGYPLMNPYQFILKKEPLPSKYDDSSSSSPDWEQPRGHSKPHYATLTAQKALDYDSYSPKFNNNPEGYGYQHTYKAERETSHSNQKYSSRFPSNNNKRGKRGGVPHPNVGKKNVRGGTMKDIEANIALRPPPKI